MGFFAVFAPLQLSLNGWWCSEPVVMGSHTEFGRKNCSNWCYIIKCFLRPWNWPNSQTYVLPFFSFSFLSLFVSYVRPFFFPFFFPFLFPMFLFFFSPFLFPLFPLTRVHSLFFLVGIPWVCDLLSIFKKVIKDQNMRTLWAKKSWAQSKGIIKCSTRNTYRVPMTWWVESKFRRTLFASVGLIRLQHHANNCPTSSYVCQKYVLSFPGSIQLMLPQNIFFPTTHVCSSLKRCAKCLVT